MTKSIQRRIEEFCEGIERLKNGEWKGSDSETDEAVNAGYRQGISDVLSMIQGEWCPS